MFAAFNTRLLRMLNSYHLKRMRRHIKGYNKSADKLHYYHNYRPITNLRRSGAKSSGVRRIEVK